jgi:arylsulfatase A-like enzyme
MVEHLDSGIGRVLKTLDDLDIAGNTLVIFTSDNGPSAEPNNHGPEGADFSNGPLRGYKFGTHEGGIRVPFIARWPGKIPAASVRPAPAITTDILPTALEAARVTPAASHEIHGTSILGLLRGQPFERRGALHWENQHNAAVLAGDWKLVHRFYLERPFLYRVEEDISEKRDLAAQHPDKVAELLALHAQWKARHYPNPVPRVTQRSSYMFPKTPQDP